MPSPCYAGPPAGAGLFAFVKRSRGCGGGAPDALPLDLSHLWPRRRDSSVGCPGGGGGGGRCGQRVGCGSPQRRLALPSPKSCVWPKSEPVPPGGLAARPPRGFCMRTAGPGRSPGAPDPARPQCFNFPGVQPRGQAAARCRRPPSASSAATSPPPPPPPSPRRAHTFPATRSAQVPRSRAPGGFGGHQAGVPGPTSALPF